MTLAVRDTTPAPTKEEILAAIGIRANDPKAAAAVLLCQRYGLDPVLKHVLIVGGNVYVTRDGLLYVAHRSGQLDGMEVLEMGETETHYTARVAVYRKDMSRPFIYPGRYPKTGKNKEFAPEMAVKVSEVMGLRRAWSIAASVLEERWDLEHDQPEPVRHHEPAVQVLPPAAPVHARTEARAPARGMDGPPITDAEADMAALETDLAPFDPTTVPGVRKGQQERSEPRPITPAQLKALQVGLRALGFTDSDDDRQEARAFISWLVGRKTPAASSKDLTFQEGSKALDRLGGETPDGWRLDDGAAADCLNAFHASAEMAEAAA